MTIPFKCPNCGGETLEASSELHSGSDLKHSVCAGCGRHFTGDDIRSQAKKIMDQMVRDAIRKPGKS
jgi:hypothetical protein